MVFITVPLLSFHAAAGISREQNSCNTVLKLAWISGVLLTAATATNGIHGMHLKFGDEDSYTHGRLFYMQDSYSLIVTGLWEGCMIIGILPSNSDYRQIFEQSHINAVLKENNETVWYTSVQVQSDEHGADLIMEKELLAIKTRIHDELGQSLLLGRRFLTSPDKVDADQMLSQWRRAVT